MRLLQKKNQVCDYIYVVTQNLVKIGRSAAELFAYFLFSKWRPSAWIW